jgi:hypothetical protein
MRKCWRSWPRTMWRLSPHSSLWPTSAPEPPRVVHGTRPHRPGLPSRVARVPSPGTVRRKRRRTTTTRRRGPPLWSLQPRPGARATATNTHSRRGVTAAHALCTPTVATSPQSVARSLTSQNASASGTSSLPKIAPHLVADLAKKRSTTTTWPRQNGTSGINHPRGTCRTSSLEAPTPVGITRWTPWGTLCSPVYGAEACLPPETLLDSPRVQTSDEPMQKWLQHEDKDSLIKHRWEPRVRT